MTYWRNLLFGSWTKEGRASGASHAGDRSLIAAARGCPGEILPFPVSTWIIFAVATGCQDSGTGTPYRTNERFDASHLAECILLIEPCAVTMLVW